jgi:hypothetical protein
MAHLVWSLLIELCLLLAAAQGLCWVLARGLGARLEARAMALGLALPLLFLSPYLFDDTLLAPTGVIAGVLPLPGLPPVRFSHLVQSDTMYQFLPWELEIRHALRQHRLPLWSDLLDGGSSLWNNPQAGVLSPLAMLARPLAIQHFLLGLLALKMLLAYEGTWLLARQLGISRASAWLVAAGFTLGGGMMSWALFPHTAALAWVPWLTLGCIRLWRRPRARAVATTAVITAAMLLSGHPETAAAGGLLAAVCACGLSRRRARQTGAGAGAVGGTSAFGGVTAAAEAAGGSGVGGPAGAGGRAAPGGRTAFARGLGAAVAAALLGFALAAPQLLPFAYALPAAERTRDMLALDVSGHHARLLAPKSWFLAPSAAFVLAPINPRVYGIPYQEPFRGPVNWVDALSGYTGLLAFAGAAIALLAASASAAGGASGMRGGGRARRARPWLGFVIVSLLLAAGFVPFALLQQAVPLLRLPTYTRLLPVACLALAVAGGFGTDLLLRRRVPGAVRARAGAALGLAAAASLAADRSPYVLLLWGLLAVAALLAPWRRQVAVAALALALGLDLVPWAERLLPRGQPALFYPPNTVTSTLARETGSDLAAAGGGGAPTPATARRAGGRGTEGPAGGPGAEGPTGGPGTARPAGGPGTEGPAGGPGTGRGSGTWRAVGMSVLVYPSLLPVYGIAEARPDNVLTPAAYLRVLKAAFGFNPTLVNYYASFDNPDHPLLSFLGIRAVVGSVLVPRPRTLVPVPFAGSMASLIFRNPRALPRWFVPSAVEPIERPALDRWIAGLADPGRVAVFRDELAGAGADQLPAAAAAAAAAGEGTAAASTARAAGGSAPVLALGEVAARTARAVPAPVRSAVPGTVRAAQPLAAAPGRALLTVPGSGLRLLATSIQGPTGWHARAAGGARLGELTVDGAFLGVVVPPGVSRVELAYRPPGLVPGTALALLALLIVSALAVSGGRGAGAAGARFASAAGARSGRGGRLPPARGRWRLATGKQASHGGRRAAAPARRGVRGSLSR